MFIWKPLQKQLKKITKCFIINLLNKIIGKAGDY